MKVEDMMGNELKVGDTIAYPGRSGSSLWMTTSVIIAIDEYEDYWTKRKMPLLRVVKPSGKKTQVYSIERVIRIQP